MKALAKLTRVVDGTPEFINDPPVLVAPRGARRTGRGGCASRPTADKLVRSYKASLPDDRRVLIERYRFVDIARKVVGVGSVGTRAWVVLMLGRDRRRPAAAAGQGSPARRSWSRTSAPAGTATTASASSRVSA